MVNRKTRANYILSLAKAGGAAQPAVIATLRATIAQAVAAGKRKIDDEQ